jgi:methionyl-tRNA formyltransferase
LTLCKERQIPFIETSRPSEGARDRLSEWRPDIIVAAYYARLFPPELLKLSRLGAINAHPGKFPRYQGPMPTPWYILNGEETFGMGIFQVDEGIDTGPVFVEREYPIPPDVTGHQLLRLTMKAAAEMYIEYFDPIVRGEIAAKPQHGEPLFCPRIAPQLHLDWTAPRELIERQIRVHAKPYFPAYTFAYNRMITINRARADDLPNSSSKKAGQIVRVEGTGSFAVQCGDASLLVEDYEFHPPLGRDDVRFYLEVGTQLA